ncbi:hypothetical protein TNIN_113021 [Trichonephila inaurata madagascariensis]|uniref:Uncharacterized protein n=1 Tax=Trichonephila inaurata madagascariensis TaxID=2747483 RepID=A0A8X7CLP6_9ARAC|nr:hypothetical protein TNIN_113021 [Trichonephila inaurata madagascariensis]
MTFRPPLSLAPGFRAAGKEEKYLPNRTAAAISDHQNCHEMFKIGMTKGSTRVGADEELGGKKRNTQLEREPYCCPANTITLLNAISLASGRFSIQGNLNYTMISMYAITAFFFNLRCR